MVEWLMKDCADPHQISITRWNIDYLEKEKEESFIQKWMYYYLKYLRLQIFCRELIIT